jgi:predicted metal-binding membrane protein
MIAGSLIEGVLRRDRILAIAGLLAVIVLCWAYLLSGAGAMQEMGGMLMPMSTWPWTAEHASLMAVMWITMMAAMMLPSAAPMILLYATIARGRRERGGRAGNPVIFASGYLVVWAAFSLVAVALQFGLESASLLSPMMETTSVALAASVLIAAGIYQWTSFKQVCLRRCRSPLEFVLTQWREGQRGAFLMGCRHGATCVGCCWVMMLLLFVGGVMNLAWVAGLAVFVLVEKLAPAGYWIGRAAGVVLVGWGIALVIL